MSTLKVDGIRSNSASSDAITLASDGTCTANITNRSNRNLIINGAMQVAQRGTSSTAVAYQTVDRFQDVISGPDENPTQSQHTLTSSDTGVFEKGFRKSYHIQNGNQTGGAGAADDIHIEYRIEAQDIANSGWDYKSSSSFLTLSFWVKSSVAQNFYGFAQAVNATKRFPFETGSLTADTWTKVTKTIQGDSGLSFNNDTSAGLILNWVLFYGTDLTGSVTLDQWMALDNSNKTPDNTSTWYTTNDATFEITGVQLEVGSVATDFEHRSYADELRRCQRYYQVVAEGQNSIIGICYTISSYFYSIIDLLVPMRTTPTMEVSNWTDAFRAYGSSGGVNVSTLTLLSETRYNRVFVYSTGTPGVGGLRVYDANSGVYGKLAFIAEL